jgi:hypothetical protein
MSLKRAKQAKTGSGFCGAIKLMVQCNIDGAILIIALFKLYSFVSYRIRY